jgi:DNA-binding CsgD family transcriptional regulator
MTVTEHATDSRTTQMMDMYRRGHTLQEIGERFGVSRERVRQILKNSFDNYKIHAPKDLRRQRKQQLLQERRSAWENTYGEKIVELYNQNLTDRQIAEKLGISPWSVAKYRNKKNLPRKRQNIWSDEQLLDAIRQASNDNKLTIPAYRTWRTQNPPKPSHLSIMARFGSFPKACQIAGVTYVGRTNSARRSDYIPPEELVDHLNDFLDWTERNNKKPTSRSLEEYRNEKGRKNVPCFTLFNVRLGGFEKAVRELAQQRNTAKQQDMY